MRGHLSLIAAPIFWCFALWLLWHVSPISDDGYGPTPTFYWGNHSPAPTNLEYANNPRVRLRFRYPYWIGAAIITFLSCGVATSIAHRLPRWRGRPFLVSSFTCLLLLILTAGTSDLGGTLGFWHGPVMWPAPVTVLRIILPISLATGLLSLIEKRWGTHSDHVKPFPVGV